MIGSFNNDINLPLTKAIAIIPNKLNIKMTTYIIIQPPLFKSLLLPNYFSRLLSNFL